MNADERVRALNDLRDLAYRDAWSHGLLEDWADGDDLEMARFKAAERVMDEIAEMQEACDSKEHYAEEMADVILVCMTFAGLLGIDIGAEVERKRAYNVTRPWKHGKVTY